MSVDITDIFYSCSPRFTRFDGMTGAAPMERKQHGRMGLRSLHHHGILYNVTFAKEKPTFHSKLRFSTRRISTTR